MRQIKFRGKSVGGIWVYGYYHKSKATRFDKECQDKNLVDSQGFSHWIKHSEHQSASRVDPETVGEFTGLLDKNSKEIYEGDIVIAHYWNGYEDLKFKAWIRFDNGRFQLMRKDMIQDTISGSMSCEVISNIYENPELLKK